MRNGISEAIFNVSLKQSMIVSKIYLYRIVTIFIFSACFYRPACVFSEDMASSGLLFYLSAENGLTADFAQGDPEPNYIRGIEIVPDGVKGSAFQCAGTQLMAYEAPGNIYAQRGTLAFFWRSGEP
ncbi:MAG: hypothetical protein HOC71_15145, partial [Candidatus Latescibacteria bacterium]|nr:hypothetical protein [Candidatus Latescibacterota bacterium]